MITFKQTYLQILVLEIINWYSYNYFSFSFFYHLLDYLVVSYFARVCVLFFYFFSSLLLRILQTTVGKAVFPIHSACSVFLVFCSE